MNIAIMQPYYLPYIGYWQLLSAVDLFVVYDDIKYTKKGWINRNRYLSNGKSAKFSIPIEKDSDYLFVSERKISNVFLKEKQKILRKIDATYKKAPLFDDVFPLIASCFNFPDINLFNFIYNSIEAIKEYLEIDTNIKISSSIGDFTTFKGEYKVVKICQSLNAEKYINPIGGLDIYDINFFRKHGIEIKFLKSKQITYKQFNNSFVPWLSILDVIMFNSVVNVQAMLKEYDEL